MKQRLEEHGLWPDQADAVMEAVCADPDNCAMSGRWDDETADYSPQTIVIVWMSARAHAVKWIDANRPRHFARQAFCNAMTDSGKIPSTTTQT